MATLKFYLDTRNKESIGDEYPLKLAINHKGKTALIALSVKVKKTEFLREGLVIKRRDADEMNAYLSKIKTEANKALLKIVAECEKNISVTDIRDRIKEEVFGNEPKCYMFVSIIREAARLRSKGTQGAYEATINALRKYDRNVDKKQLSQINKAYALKFADFLVSDLGIKESTSNIYLSKIRRAFNYAMDMEYINTNPFRKVNLKALEPKHRNLTIEELREIFCYKETNPRVAFARDMFKLMFLLLGVNYSDLFGEVEIKRGRLEYYRNKTSVFYSIKIVPEAQEIIDRYKGSNGFINRRHIRYYSAYARLLKMVCGGKYPYLTTYYSRHSVATIMYELGIPKDIISQALGHSFGLNVTGRYIQTNNRLVDVANRMLIDAVLYNNVRSWYDVERESRP